MAPRDEGCAARAVIQQLNANAATHENYKTDAQMPESAGRAEPAQKPWQYIQDVPEDSGTPDQNMRPFGCHSRAALREPASHDISRAV